MLISVGESETVEVEEEVLEEEVVVDEEVVVRNVDGIQLDRSELVVGWKNAEVASVDSFSVC